MANKTLKKHEDKYLHIKKPEMGYFVVGVLGTFAVFLTFFDKNDLVYNILLRIMLLVIFILVISFSFEYNDE